MRIKVEGKTPLSGVYRPAGSANAAQALIAGSLLTEAPVTLHNVPRTLSTLAMLEQAARLGAVVAWPDDDRVTLDAAAISRRPLAQGESDASLGLILFLPALLARRQHARLEVDFPLNRIRPHLEALRDLGQDVVDAKRRRGCTRGCLGAQGHPSEPDQRDSDGAGDDARQPTGQGNGYPQCGHRTARAGTGPLSRTDGRTHRTTRLERGARVRRGGFGGAEATVGPDLIEAASVAAISALSGGRLQIEGVPSADLRLIARIYQRLGVQLELSDDQVFVPKHELLTVSNREEDVDASIETAPWPGFPSDLIAIATVIATQARGTSLIHEKLYANRLLFVDKLKAMGAQIVLCDPHRAIVIGPSPLHGDLPGLAGRAHRTGHAGRGADC